MTTNERTQEKQGFITLIKLKPYLTLFSTPSQMKK